MLERRELIDGALGCEIGEPFRVFGVRYWECSTLR